MSEFNHGKINQAAISSEMRTSFLDYAMSVIVARALPDVRDGLKPVHRRIIFAMNDLGITSDKSHKKSARIVGDVIGKYHPHGDTAVYDAMVRMAQPFSFRYPLVDGHGNFGNIDGDGAAAMRYTEARMSKIATELVKDINKNTVDFVENYDGEESEPAVLPSRFPNLLVNGSTGIAVGMATNIPPHNLRETINACIKVMENPDIDVTELMETIHGPDFPTYGIILGRSGIRSAFETGRGSIILRGKAEIQEKNGRNRIVITEIPYQVNKEKLVERIAQLVRDKIVEGISDLSDLSNREGIMIVVDLKRDVQGEVILNQLYRLTPLQTSFSVNLLALVNNSPKQLGIIEVLKLYINHQVEIIERKTKFDLDKALDRAHILEGFRIALDNIDEIIKIIRASNTDTEIIQKFDEKFGLTELQSKAILEMKLRRLSGLERSKIEDEYNKIMELIADLKDILANHTRVLEIIRVDLEEISNKFGDDRRSEIIDGDYNFEDEDLIPEEKIVISLSINGYIKRLTVDTYRSQNRGGRGIKGMTLNDDDVIDNLVSCSTHDYVLIFTNFGKVYRIKGYQIPKSSRTGKGIPVVNLLSLDKEEIVRSILPIGKDDESKYLFFATRDGLVKRTTLSQFDSIRQNGKIAISLKDDDQLVSVKMTNGNDEIILASTEGKAVRFNENNVRAMGRNASGVKGMNVDNGKLIGLCTNKEGEMILSLSENGYGKITPLQDYRLTKRGGKGVKAINATEKTGKLMAVKTVSGDEDILIMTTGGVIIRTAVGGISQQGRGAQGVKIITCDNGTCVSNLALVEREEEVLEEEIENSDSDK